MNKFFFVAFLFWSSASYSQIKALTENGDEVILSDDGTWNYLDEREILSKSIAFNSIEFNKEVTATFPVRSAKNGQVIYIDPKKWSFQKSEENPSAEYAFKFHNDEIYGIVINEKVEIPLEALREIALTNAKKVSPNAKIDDEDYRNVNGQKTLMLKFSGALQGMKFSYFGYYFSSPKGSTQLITYTFESLYDEYEAEMEAFLNGLTTTIN